MKVILEKVRSMATASIYGRIVQNTQVPGSIITLEGTEPISGLMVEVTKGVGKRTKCMGRAFTYGQMPESLMVSMLKTIKQALVFMNGLTAGNTKATGQMVNSMEKENSQMLMAKAE